MNERIRELAYEAEDYADGIVDEGGEFHEAYTKKFAELIVKDCINNMENCDGDLDFAIWKTKKYFGVEL